MEIEAGEFCGGMTNTNGCEKRVDHRWVPSLLDACKKLEHSSSSNPSHKFLPNFCVTCEQLYCRSCRQFRRTNNPHQHHVVLLVYKASHANCLHASEASKLIDISDIHPFKINKNRIVFLYRRGSEQRKSLNKNSGYACKTCGRKLDNDKKFCSVQCKFLGCDKSKSESCNMCKTCGRELQGQKKFCSIQSKSESGKNISLIKQNAEGKGKEEKGEIEDERPPVEGQSYRKRRRKGVPSRSPLQ